MSGQGDSNPSPKFSGRTSSDEIVAGVDLSGKTIVITGTTNGIGTETAKALAAAGAHVVMLNRNIVLAQQLKQDILQQVPNAKIDLVTVDLSSLQSVQAAAKEILNKEWKIYCLVLNAGLMKAEPRVSIDNLETTFAVNHLAGFYLLQLLLPRLRENAPSRVVLVSSSSHSHTGLRLSDPLDARLAQLCPEGDSTDNFYRLYAYSKLCNVLSSFKLHREENSNGIETFVLHPGAMIPTNISHNFNVLRHVFTFFTRPFTKTLKQGAATTVLCAASPTVEGKSGLYWQDCRVAENALQTELARDEALQDGLWDLSQSLIAKYEASRQ